MNGWSLVAMLRVDMAHNASHTYAMGKTVIMDPAGRVVLPRATRERFGLTGAAHRLEIVEASDGIVLRPTGVDVPVTRDASGWIVFHSDAAGAVGSLDPVALVDAERSRRGQQVAGE